MTDVLLAVSPLEEFLTGSLFGYLLHAVQLGIAEGMCGIYLERRSRFALRAVGAVVVYLVLAACLGMLFGEIFPYISFLVSCVVSFPCFMFCFRCNLWDGLFCCVAAIGVQNLSYSVCIFCVGLFGWDVAQLNVLHIAVQTLIYLSVHLLCFVLGVRKLKDIGGGFGKERLVMIVVMLILTAIVYLMQYDRQTPGSADFFDWRILFICYDIISLLMLFGMYDRNNLRRQNAILDSLRISEEKQYEFDRRAIEMVNIKCHDLKHQLIALRSRADGEFEQSLKEMEDAVVIYDAIAKTGCKPLDVVLTSKYFICEQEGIAFTYMIDGETLSFMRAGDIYSLFGNAIDNAIRAELKVSDRERRFIGIRASARGKLFYIQVENCCEETIVCKNGLPVTTKPDGENHGFGMISMKRIVERYGGAMTVDCDDGIFRLSITLPVPAEG